MSVSYSALIRRPDIRTALGTWDHHSPNQARMLEILLDPDNVFSATALELEDLLDELQCFTGTDIDESRVIGERLGEYYARQPGQPSFDFELIHDRSGIVDNYNVLVSTGHLDVYLARSHDAKYLYMDRQGLTGLSAAMSLGQLLDAEYQDLAARLRHIEQANISIQSPGIC